MTRAGRWRGQAKVAHVLQQLSNTVLKAQALMNMTDAVVDDEHHDRLERFRKSIDAMANAYEGRFDPDVIYRARVCSQEISSIIENCQVPHFESLAQTTLITDSHATNPLGQKLMAERGELRENSTYYQKPKQPNTVVYQPSSLVDKDQRRLNELNLQIDKAKTLMSAIERTLPYISHSVLSDYRRLTRLNENVYNIIKLFQDRGLHEACDQATIDQENITNFVKRHQKHFPKKMTIAHSMPPTLVSDFLKCGEATAHSHTNSADCNKLNNGPRPEIIDLTMESDNDLVITVDDSASDIEAREERALAVLQAEREGWLDYEYRRDVVLWYRPELDFDGTCLP